MDFCCRTFAILFLLCAPTSCAPGLCLPDAWAGVRASSLELLRMAQKLEKAWPGTKYHDSFNTNLGWIEAEDKCDTETLRKAPESCLRKILSVSLSYSSELEELFNFKNCSAFAKELMTALNKFQNNMRCANVNAPSAEGGIKEKPEVWEEENLCLYILNRLISFSILTARVFAVGNPSHHPTSDSRTCV